MQAYRTVTPTHLADLRASASSAVAVTLPRPVLLNVDPDGRFRTTYQADIIRVEINV